MASVETKAMLHTGKAHCPYCGEPIELLIDCSVEAQEYIEDCFVCCRPIVVTAECTQGELLKLSLYSENE